MTDNYIYNIGSAYRKIVAEHGTRPALKYMGGDIVTHDDLNALANRMAAYLADQGLNRRDIVAIVNSKTPRCFALMLAALKLGITYVNLDDRSPAARLVHILATATPMLIMGEEIPENVQSAAKERNIEFVEMVKPSFLETLASLSSSEPLGLEAVSGADPAYIMYTSGSTGIPKGALITHANVINFSRWVEKRFNISAADTFTNLNPMYFDNSVFDFYGALLNGASLAPVPRDALSDATLLLDHVEASKSTIWFSVPSLLIFLITMKALSRDRLSTIKSFVFGGEGYPKTELRKLYSLFGHRSDLINVYGPTECTCICSAWNVRAVDLENESGLVTLGPVADNFSTIVLNEGRQAAPGETGELCLLGPQVGLGYMNDRDRTASAFVDNPFNLRWRERMYKTGDLVRIAEDGISLNFVGRADNQIKHMGYRIELEEIEAAINKITNVSQSVAILHSDRRGIKVIVAYIAGNTLLREDGIRSQLETLLPQYMIPQRFIIRESLPKNANGKLDRIALADELRKSNL